MIKAFDYIDLGVRVEQIFWCTNYMHKKKNSISKEEYDKLMDICYEALENVGLDCKIDGMIIVGSENETVFDIPNYFEEPYKLHKKTLFEVGHNLMLFAIIDEGKITTKEINRESLYYTLKNLLNILEIPSDDLLNLLEDSNIGILKRIQLFADMVDRYFDQKENNNNKTQHIEVTGNNGNVIVIDGKENNVSNISNYNNEKTFSELIKVIALQIDNNERLLELVEEMKESEGTKDYNKKYQEFISSAADHMTILAPFISWLTSLLVL